MIIIDPPPVPDMPFTYQACAGEAVNLEISNATDFVSINWNDGVSAGATYTTIITEEEI